MQYALLAATVLLLLFDVGRPAAQQRPPIIDMHMHAYPDGPLLAGEGLTEESHRRGTLSIMERFNIVKALVSAGSGRQSFDLMERWRQAAPDRVIPSMGFHLNDSRPDPAALREAICAGRVGAIGEILAQYDGLAPGDPSLLDDLGTSYYGARDYALAVATLLPLVKTVLW
jgi:hypothetical protein